MSKRPAGGIRTFIAIELPPPIRAELARVQDQLREHASVLKLIGPDLLHLTVRFLGAVPPERVDAVVEAAREAARGSAPFPLRLGPVGSFGGAAPRVVWVGLAQDGGLGSLQQMYARLEDGLHSAGFERERRPLSPHLTIARVREDAPRAEVRSLGETVARLAAQGPLPGRFDVRALTVMRSDLSPRGPRYTPMAHAELGREEEVRTCG